MLRNIHFFNIKPGADEKRILHLLDNEIAEYARTFGCLERKTWKFLSARSGPERQPTESAMYMNESLWPSQKGSDAFTQAIREAPPEEVKNTYDEMIAVMELEKTVRYVDEEG